MTIDELKRDCIELDVLCFTETFLKTGQENYIKLSEYEMATNYCRDKSRGGSCILVKKGLDFKDLTFLKQHTCQNVFEICGIDIPCIKTVIICLYRTPTSDVTVFIKKLDNVLYELFRKNKFNGNIVITGDFNINLLKSNTATKLFLDLVNSYNLTNHINAPTRKNSCLDLVLSNIKKTTASVLPLHLSDHNTAQMLEFPIKHKKLKPAFHFIYVRDYSLENVIKFENHLTSLSWSNIYEEQNFNRAFNEFHELFCLLYTLCFPKIKKKISNTGKKQNWISNGLKISCKMKRQLRYQYYKDKSSINKKKYNTYSRILQKCIVRSRKTANMTFINNSSNKCRASWTIINKEINDAVTSNTIDKIQINDQILTHPVDIANTFNEHFIHSTTVDDNIKCQQPVFIEHSNTMCNSLFLTPMTPIEVKKIVKSLRDTKSVGFDEISTRIVKNSIDKILEIITYLINFSFESGTFPDILKLSLVKPLHKKGCKHCIENYRPITLVSVWSKVFEKCMHDRLITFLNKYNIINSDQYGFQKSKSTTLAIFSLIRYTLNKLNENYLTTALFLDLSKAFDCISHEHLLKKIEEIGLRGPANEWIASYLHNRTQQVVITNYTKEKELISFLSNPQKNIKGVPQGSVLGPTLFLLYINNISNVTHHKCILFADDITVIVTSDGKTNTILDHENDINNTLNNIIQWLDINNLAINLNKTSYIQFNHCKHIQFNFNLNIIYKDIRIKQFTETKFLGILIDQDINWKSHIDNLNKRVNKFVYALKHVRKITNISTALVSYHAYVESILRYGLLVWGNSTDFSRVFIAQKKCIRALGGIPPDESCKPLFKKFGLLPLPSLYILEVCMFVKKHYNLFKKACEINTRARRDPERLVLEFVPKSTKYNRNCVAMCIKVYNKVPKYLKSLNTSRFSVKLREWLRAKNYYSVDEFLSDKLM